MSSDTNYYKLQIEFSQYKKETEELLKEYESSENLLSESIEQFKADNSKIKKQYETVLSEKTALQLELDSIKGKNNDKMKDIELLNIKIEQHDNEMKAMKDEKEGNHSKIITLETDNDYYLGKMRENESLIEEQKEKMENALEDLIALQTEFDSFKADSEEKIQRLEREVQEEKSNSQTKDMIIKRKASELKCNFQLDEALRNQTPTSNYHNNNRNAENGIEYALSKEQNELLNELNNRIQRRKYDLEQYSQEVNDRLKMNLIVFNS